ncbi:MAG: tRNA 2-thiouridine(34) synthase MnmA [Terriglobia bacterium]
MTIAVAMSGGVDSSTAAAILADQNNPNTAGDSLSVVGLTMQLWNQRRLPVLQGGKESTVRPGQASGRCCSLDDAYDARRVANFLGIPYYVVNYERKFEETVVRPFVEQYLAGETPIPCSRCNTEIKFEQFVHTALSIGADSIATGHYARVRRDEVTGRYRLFAAVDSYKDQSYFLFGLTQEQLSHTLFPLGDMTKQQVRAIARERQLPVAEKPESQEICFVPNGTYRDFIDAYLTEHGQKRNAQAGEIVSTDGRILGKHHGVHNFTVGQRKGLGFATGSPLYVVAIDREKNRVVVGTNDELSQRSCVVRNVNWIRPAAVNQLVSARIKIRNKHVAAPAQVTAQSDSHALVEFVEPQRAITPGQAAVFYGEDDEVLGGGWIAKAF